MSNHLIFAAAAVLLGAAGADALADPTRISVTKFSKDAQKVDALKLGIAAMRQASDADPMSPDFHISLAYWANTHGYFGTGTHAHSMQSLQDAREECASSGSYDAATCASYYAHVVSVTPPNDGYTDAIWGTCAHGNLNFLPWHRFYLHYFERTLRKQSRDPNFALPYWSYYDNYVPSKKGLAVPPLFTGATNPLIDQWRTPGLNQRAVVMDPDAADASQAFSYADFSNFSNLLQGQPHGTMHCATGSGCAMPDIGMVPVAGADPMFYMHHANIDRLWQCWMKKKANGQTIDLAWAKANLGMGEDWFQTKFSFADENGKPVSVSVADVFSPEFSPQYDSLDNCNAKPPALLKPKPAGRLNFAVTPLKPHAPLAAGKQITLGDSAVSIGLTPIQGAAAAPKSFAGKAAAGQTYLILEDVALKGKPALTYKVYLSSKANPKNSSYVATFSYFGLKQPHGEHAGHGGAGSLGTLVYQVNANLGELGIASASDIAVRFVPTDLTMGIKVKKQNAGDGVTVANIRLETAATPPEK